MRNREGCGDLHPNTPPRRIAGQLCAAKHSIPRKVAPCTEQQKKVKECCNSVVIQVGPLRPVFIEGVP